MAAPYAGAVLTANAPGGHSISQIGANVTDIGVMAACAAMCTVLTCGYVLAVALFWGRRGPPWRRENRRYGRQLQRSNGVDSR